MKEKQISKKGISLIVLVITIIVIIILSASVIVTISSNNPIEEARRAKMENEIATVKEQAQLDIIEWQMEVLKNGGDATLNEAKIKEIIENANQDKTNKYYKELTDTAIITKNGYEVLYSELLGEVSSEEAINWDEIVANMSTNYDEYLLQAQEKGQVEETNIAIGTDGEVVNLDLWKYYKTDDGKGMSLGKGETSEGNRGYLEENLVDGTKVQGKMPQYIYIASEDKVYPVTMLQYTFAGSAVTEIPEIPDTVTNIGFETFYNCDGLKSITIPNSVTSIGTLAFSSCSGLTSITIPDSVTSIEIQAFQGCSGATSITIPDSVTSIGMMTFSKCSGLTSITIPDSVTSIDGYAFEDCTGLTSITIPDSVTSIGGYAFSGCKGLTSINVGKNNRVYDSRENCNAIIETSTNTLIRGCNTTIIPSNIVSIGVSAFSGCKGLTSITIPESVTSIGNNAFSSCSGLTSITIPESVTSISGSAFGWCTNLTTIYYKGTATGKPWGATNATVVTDF